MKLVARFNSVCQGWSGRVCGGKLLQVYNLDVVLYDSLQTVDRRMKQLLIRVTGEVNTSNFDEWKQDLIAQIQATNTELTTDEDFIEATRQVKWFKTAETALKQAKQSAVEQADQIQLLFSAIDEVSGEARQARLSLERQIKQRKQEIKDAFIAFGIGRIQGAIDQQGDLLNASGILTYLDRRRFEAALRGKTGTKGLQQAIDLLCQTIEREIAERATLVHHNRQRITALPSEQQLLFQDADVLVHKSSSDVEQEIHRRITRYEESRMALKAAEDSGANPAIALPPTVNLAASPVEHQPLQTFHITLELSTNKDRAMAIARALRQQYQQSEEVTGIRLGRARDPH
jgi:hypothetical protein